MVALLMLRTLVPRGGRGGENELYFLRILGDGAVDREAKLGVLNVFLCAPWVYLGIAWSLLTRRTCVEVGRVSWTKLNVKTN